jgi:hypothetical protein
MLELLLAPWCLHSGLKLDWTEPDVYPKSSNDAVLVTSSRAEEGRRFRLDSSSARKGLAACEVSNYCQAAVMHFPSRTARQRIDRSLRCALSPRRVCQTALHTIDREPPICRVNGDHVGEQRVTCREPMRGRCAACAHRCSRDGLPVSRLRLAAAADTRAVR